MRTSVIALITLAFAHQLVAQQPAIPGPSFESIISLKSVGSPAVSPDGKAIAYTVTSTDWSENRYDTEIWLWREGGAAVQLTRTEKGSSTSPKWSPNGRWIAFLADRGDKQQIHLIGAEGGEAWPLTAVKEGAQSFEWAPDGKRIAFTRSDPEPGTTKQRKERYGEFAIEDQEFQPSHLWLVRVPGAGEPAAVDTQPQRNSFSTRRPAGTPRRTSTRTGSCSRSPWRAERRCGWRRRSTRNRARSCGMPPGCTRSRGRRPNGRCSGLTRPPAP